MPLRLRLVMTKSSRHHPVARITHWVSALALTVMAASGMRIFNAAPFFARKGDAPFAWWPCSTQRSFSDWPRVHSG